MPASKDSDRISTVNPRRRFWLAVLIIVPSFIIIAYLISLSAFVPQSGTDGSNPYTEIFNILLPLFAAWVGAVVAFYFGSENLQQAQQTLNAVISTKEKLSTKTIDDLLKEHPSARNVKTITMKNKIKEIKSVFENSTNTVVVDLENKPLGILYSFDLSKIGVNLYEVDSTNDDKSLEDVVVDIKEDYITKQPWDKAVGVTNYVRLSLSDNLFQAKERMRKKANSLDNILSVRGIVVDDAEKVFAIINFANISSGILLSE